MTVTQRAAVPREFSLASGRIAAEVSGAGDAPLVIGIPGLSANLRSFDEIYAALDPGKHRGLAYDPRGRGRSEETPAGTYTWPAHARDIAAMADQLGAEQFDLVGWSMGTWIAMKVCQMFPGRVCRLVLIDGGGLPDDAAIVPIYAGLQRLGTVYPSRETFDTAARAIGVYEPWDVWERYFDYEFEVLDGGAVRARTGEVGPWEDENYRKTQDPYALWRAVTMPSLVVKAAQPLPGDGYILNQADLDRFLRDVPGSRSVEVDANHYGIGIHPDTAHAIANFLDE